MQEFVISLTIQRLPAGPPELQVPSGELHTRQHSDHILRSVNTNGNSAKNAVFISFIIFFSGRFRHDIDNQRAQQYIIECTELEQNDTFIFWMNRTYSQTGFQVCEERSVTQSHCHSCPQIGMWRTIVLDKLFSMSTLLVSLF